MPYNTTNLYIKFEYSSFKTALCWHQNIVLNTFVQLGEFYIILLRFSPHPIVWDLFTIEVIPVSNYKILALLFCTFYH